MSSGGGGPAVPVRSGGVGAAAAGGAVVAAGAGGPIAHRGNRSFEHAQHRR